MTPTASLWTALLCSYLAAGEVCAQDADSSYPLFADQTPLTLKLSGPFRTVLGDEGEDERTEYPAVIEFPGPDGTRITQDIEIRLRGKARARICNFPPLSLDFPRSEVAGTVFSGQNRIKLVTLCKQTNRYRDYLGQEFLIYLMWQTLSDRAFRVRWATVEYVDTSRDRGEPEIEPAFLIEEDWEVAERLGLEVVEEETIARDSLDVPHTALLFMFQYLIGNTDLSVLEGPEEESCCHNNKVLRSEDGRNLMVPYDFDSAGMIDAEYAYPAQTMQRRLSSVRQRLYRGFCIMNDEIESAIEAVNAHREEMLAILDNDVILTERGSERAIDYVSDSFEIINDPRQRERRLYGDCR